jgi:hypothetical protein
MLVFGMTNQENETLNLQKTAEALRLHDECRSLVMHLPASAPISEVTRLNAELDQLAEKVGEAFADDTADRNPRDTALLTRPDQWLRELCAKYAPIVVML